MKWGFIVIAIATAAIWLGRWMVETGQEDESAEVRRRSAHGILSGYAVLTALILCFLAWYYTGFSVYGNSQSIPPAERRRIEHLGYYLQPGAAFGFGGGETSNVFHDPALKGKEHFELAPVFAKNAPVEIQQWKLTWSPLRQSLRVNHKAINVPEALWMKAGDTISVCRHFQPPAGCASLTYSGKDNEVFTFSVDPEMANSERPREFNAQLTINRGISEADLIRSRKDWHKNFPQLSDLYWTAFSGITWVREKEGDPESRIGLIISGELLSQDNLVLLKNKDRITPLNGLAEGQQMVGSRDILTYGLTGTLRLNLADSKRSEVDPQGHPSGIVELRFERPVSWTLPPSVMRDSRIFVLTSSDDYIPVDGYSFDLPDPGRPFYAKAELVGDDLAGWQITSEKKTYKEGEIVHLGSISQGVLLRLASARAALPGWWAGIAIVISLVAFLGALRMDRRQRNTYRFHFIWATVWALTLAVLTFRFLLTYRLSLLPPTDAYARDLQLFSQALTKALLGYAVPIIVVLAFALSTIWNSPYLSSPLTRFREATLARLQKPLVNWLGIGEEFGARPKQDILTLLGPVILITAACFLRHQQQSILGLRISIWANLMATLLLLLFCLRMPAKAEWRAGLAFALFLPLVAQIVIIRDRGAVLYGTTLWGVALFVWLWHKPERQDHRYATFAFIGFQLVIAFLIVAALWHGSDNVVSYRINAWLGRGSEVLLSTDDQQQFDFDHFRRTMLQTWQMLAYAAQGSSAPGGYGRTLLSHVGMSYASSMSDSAYGIYVLGEHGPTIGLLVVGFLVTIGVALFLSFAYFSPGTRRASFGIVLFAIGGYFVVHTLYMALANVGWLPFTGQNIPMLSLDSGGDLLQAACLLGLAMFLLGAEPYPSTSPAQPVRVRKLWPRRRNWRLTFFFMIAIIPLAGGLLIYRVFALSRHSDNYVRDNNLPEDVIRDIRTHIPEDAKEPDTNSGTKDERRPGWQLTRDGRLEPTGDISPRLIESELVDDFNTRPDKFDPQKGYLYLVYTKVNGKDRLGVRVNQNYFRVVLPFADREAWTGTILADTGLPMPTLCGLSRRSQQASYCLSLSEQGSGKSEQCSVQSKAPDNLPPMLTRLKTAGQIISDSNIVCRDDHGNPVFSVRREGDQMVMSGYPGVVIREDGEDYRWLAPLKAQSVIDVIVAGNPSASQNLIYLGMHRDTVAFSQWRNGRWRRVFPLGTELPMAYAIGRAADQVNKVTAKNEGLATELHLSLNVHLQRELLGDFADYIGHHSEDYLDTNQSSDLMGKRLAAVVMDAFSGEIKAMPSWPYADPAEDTFEEDLEQARPSVQVSMLRNHNFDSHVIGSTVKPLVFSAVASGFWPQDISQLTVLNIEDPVTVRPPLAVHLHDHIGGLPIGHPWDCDSTKSPVSADDFLVYSSDYYESILAIAGSALNKNSWGSMLSSTATKNSTPVKYKGQPYHLDLANIRNSSYPDSLFTLDDLASGRPPLISSVNQNETVLFKQLQTVFGGLQIAQTGHDSPETRWSQAVKLLPQFFHTVNANMEAGLTSDAATPIMPEPVRIDAMANLHPDYLLCLLGGGPACRFNNAWMAQSAARLASGRQITAALEKRAQPPVFSALPAPLNDRAWVNAHLFSPLHDVGIKGTAKDLRLATFAKSCSGMKDSDCYMALYKTGTLDEGTAGRESEALLFIVGLWRNESFVPGRTIAGFIYMEDAKKKKLARECGDCGFKKFDFARPIVLHTIAYLQSLDAEGNRKEKSPKENSPKIQSPQKRKPAGNATTHRPNSVRRRRPRHQ